MACGCRLETAGPWWCKVAIPEELKGAVFAYCREVEDAENLAAMTVAWDSAAAYLEGGGVSRPTPGSSRHALWLSVACALTLDEYDQRGAQMEGGKLQENLSFQRKLNQLKLTEPNLDTKGQERI